MNSMKTQMDLLLSHEWQEEEKALIAKVIKNILDYGRFIPKTIKDDVNSILLLANRLKIELDTLNKCKYECKCECNCKCNCECNCECKREST